MELPTEAAIMASWKNTDIPLVSICSLAYNHEKYIHSAIEGFLTQKTNFPFEIIIHDDASTDNTAQIIKEYELQYPNIFKPIYQSENQRSQKIRPSPTYVWPKAKGKYIALCEGDDYWTDPLKLQKQVDFLEENEDCQLCYHATKLNYDNDSYSSTVVGPKKIQQAHKLTIEDLLSDGLRSLGIRTESMVFKSSVIETMPDWVQNAPLGDYALKLLCAYAGKIGYIPDIMGVYRRGNIGSWSFGSNSVEWLEKRQIDYVSIISAFNSYSNYEFSKIIKRRIKKSRINHLSHLQPYLSRKKMARLIKTNFSDMLDFTNNATSIIWTRFLLGEKLYAGILHFYNGLKKKSY